VKTSAAVLLLALWPMAAWAQDTRTVTEPVIPPVCAALAARLAAVDGRTLAPDDERRPDTARIQQALDACPAGQAVEPAVSELPRDGNRRGGVDLSRGGGSVPDDR